MVKNFAILFFLLFLGCAISNEGSVDYRYQKVISDGTSTLEKYVKPAELGVSSRNIKAGDPIEISIKQIYIDDFTELASPLRIVRGEPANGEVAIVVNAFEKSDGQLNFGPSGLENAKVVFFSDDVWEGQFLNISNLSSIYGPLKYNGNNFILDFYIIEFDQPGEQLKQLITNLSELGSTFYPPAAPISGALSKLAGSLITDQQEDRMFHYTFELKPSGGGDQNLPTGIFEAGNYAFIREKNRRNNTKWSELTINQRNGRIVYTTSLDENKNSLVCDQETNPPEKCYYKENSYIVVEVNKAKTSLQKDMSQMLYKDLVTDLSDAAPAILREDLPADALEQLSAGLSELRNSDQMIQDINILESDSISEVVNKSIGESFMELWFGTQKDTQNNDILKHKISATDKERMERRLSELVFHCQKAKDSVNYSASVMNIMKDIRERKISNSSDLEIYEAISCKFKQ